MNLSSGGALEGPMQSSAERGLEGGTHTYKHRPKLLYKDTKESKHKTKMRRKQIEALKKRDKGVEVHFVSHIHQPKAKQLKSDLLNAKTNSG